jgi:hypothetical protein
LGAESDRQPMIEVGDPKSTFGGGTTLPHCLGKQHLERCKTGL